MSDPAPVLRRSWLGGAPLTHGAVEGTSAEPGRRVRVVRAVTAAGLIATIGLLVAGIWLAVANRGLRVEAPVPGPVSVFLPTQISATVVWTCAAVVMLRRPEVMWAPVCAAAALGHALGAAAFGWATRVYVVGDVATGGDVAVWLLMWVLPLEVVALNWMAVTVPDGRLGTGWVRRWSYVALAASVAGIVIAMVASFDGHGTDFAGTSSPFGGVGLPEWVPAALLAPTGLVVIGVVVARWRASEGDTRLAMRLLVVVSVLGLVVPGLFVAVPSAAAAAAQIGGALQVLALVAIVLRHRLFGIDTLLERALLYSLLVGLLLGSYAAIVAVGDATLGRSLGPFAAVSVALIALPLHHALTRIVRRFMYGDRDRPDRVVDLVAARTVAAASPQAMLTDVLDEIARGLRLPWMSLTDPAGAELAVVGMPRGGAPESFDLVHRGKAVGTMTSAPRPGEDSLADEDRRSLAAISAHLAPLVANVSGAIALRESRDRLVMVREEERRRLRRDLHDGLGPVLTGVALSIDAAGNLASTDAAAARALLADARNELSGAISGIRRLVEGLRPPALDELGLVGAIQQHGQRLQLEVEVVRRGDLSALPAAVEVAAYRIATEALTNAARHSSATHATVTLERDDELRVTVSDDGAATGASGEAWEPGVGLGSMHERATELGGSVTAGPTEHGGRVCAVLPVEP